MTPTLLTSEAKPALRKPVRLIRDSPPLLRRHPQPHDEVLRIGRIRGSQMQHGPRRERLLRANTPSHLRIQLEHLAAVPVVRARLRANMELLRREPTLGVDDDDRLRLQRGLSSGA